MQITCGGWCVENIFVLCNTCHYQNSKNNLVIHRTTVFYSYTSLFIATPHVKIYNRLIHTSNGLSFSPHLHASNFLRQIWLMAREEYFGFRLELSHDLLQLL